MKFGKIGENVLREIRIFLLEFFKMEREREREREEIGGERRRFSTNHVVPHHPQAVGGAWPTREQRVLQAVGPTAWAVLSRAPSVRRPVSRASELRIRIRFRITNRDSLMHDNDYTTLKKG